MPSFHVLIFLSISDVSKWTGAQLRRLGSLIKGFDMNELKKVSQKAFADMIGTCAHYQTLNKETIKALADRAKQVRSGLCHNIRATVTQIFSVPSSQ